MNTDSDAILPTLPPVLERPVEIQPVPPAPRPNVRFRNFFIGLKAGQRKKNNLLKAVEFAQQLIPLQMKPEVAQKSIKLQHGFSTRQVRSIVRAARPKKHRERS
jgi:hypothetical protein